MHPSSKPRHCTPCRAFFGRYRCALPLECDCPPCQGYCRCHARAADDNEDGPPPGALFVALPDEDDTPEPEPQTP